MSLDTAALPASETHDGYDHQSKWGRNEDGRYMPSCPTGVDVMLPEDSPDLDKPSAYDIAPVPELVAKPVSECPVKSGNPLTDAQRITLKQWGICTYCREGCHSRHTCPIAPSKRAALRNQ